MGWAPQLLPKATCEPEATAWLGTSMRKAVVAPPAGGEEKAGPWQMADSPTLTCPQLQQAH